MTQYILHQQNLKGQQGPQNKGKQINDRVYKRVSYKDIICRKVVFDIFGSGIKKQHKSQDDKKSHQTISQELVLQSSVSSQYVIQIIGSRNNQYQAVLYQENFDCLLSQIQIRKLDFGERMKIFYCIAVGLKDISAALICHRSLEPRHIAVFLHDKEYIAKINHFEFAVKLKSQKSTISESPYMSQYSSPEIKSNRSHSFKTDIWSLGAILNYLLYETLQNIWEQNGEIKIQVPKGTPDWLLQLLKSMLLFDQFKRYKINTVVEIVRTSLKCVEVLSKIVPIGREYFNKKREQSQLKLI